MRKIVAMVMVVFLILATLSYQPVKAATRYVRTTGSNAGGNTCLNLATPCRTITYAIGQAVGGDTVDVGAGTYSTAAPAETFPIAIAKNLILHGAGSSTTIIDRVTHGSNVINVSGGNYSVDINGFTIRHGTIGISYNTNTVHGTVSNNIVWSNSNDGINFNYPSYGTISFNTVYENGNDGIDINDTTTYNTNAITVNANTVYNNTGNGIELYYCTSSVLVTNNVIYNTSGQVNGIENDYADVVITNNTIVGHLAGSTTHAGIHNDLDSDTTVTNNIITGNTYGIYIVGGTGSSSVNTYNDVWSNTTNYSAGSVAGTGSISSDPRYTGGTNYHLTCSPLSPAIDAGTSTGAPAADRDGTARPQGPAVDMGAYETTCGTAPVLTASDSAGCPNSIVLNWTAVTPPSGKTLSGYNVYRSLTSPVSTVTPYASLGNVLTYTDTGVSTSVQTYYYLVRAVFTDASYLNSNEDSAVTLDCVGTAPVLTASDSAGCPNSIVLNWTAVTPPSGKTLSGYNVYRSLTSPVSTVTPYASLGNVLTYTDTGVSTSVQTYYYLVRAVFTDASYLNSNEDSAVTLDCVGTAPSLTVTAATTCPNQMTLTWSGATPPVGRTISSYNIYRGTSPGVNTSGAAYANTISSPYVDTAVSTSSGVTYYYKVRAVYDNSTLGLESNEGSGTTLQCTFALTVTVVGNGSVTSNLVGIDCGSDCSEIYTYGTTVTLTATPTAISNFVGWSGDCTGTALTCTLTMDGVKNVGATFALSSRHAAPTIIRNMSYAAGNNIEKAEQLKSEAENLSKLAHEKNLDASTCERSFSEADKYLKMAKEIWPGNPIAANNDALKAIALFEEALKCLKTLLGK